MRFCFPKYTLGLGIIGCLKITSILVGREPSDVTALFPCPEKATQLSFVAENKYQVCDYTGRVVSEGEATTNTEGRLVVPFVSPAGYHEVVFISEGEAQATGMWSPPAGEMPADAYMSIDTAISWLTKPADRPVLVRNLKNVIGPGGLARERLSWSDINPQDGKWDWETARGYETTRRLYVEAGIPVLEMFHNVPGWMGRSQEGNFPDDLVAVSREWSEVARRWSGFWGGLEVWNEPDIGLGGNQPSDQYVPIVKAVRKAMTDVGVTTPLGAGVFASFNPLYLELAARNGLLDECDFLSFHYYGNPLGIEPLVAKYRAWLASANQETKPLWMTEVGMSRAGKSGVRPPVGEQMETALAYGMQAVEAKACGVARFFPFVYTEYSEHEERRHFGMLDHRHTPLRVLAASAQAGRVLAGLAYVGDIPAARVRGAERVRVFGTDTDDSALVVVYTGRVAPGATVELPFAGTSAQGADGRKLKIGKEGVSIPIDDGLTYVKVPRAALTDMLDTSTEAMRLYQLSQQVPSSIPVAAAIVLQPQIDREAMKAISVRGYFLKEKDDTVTVRLGVNNLSDVKRTVTLRVAGVQKNTVMVPAHTRVIAPLEITVKALPGGMGGDDRRIDISATSDDGSRIAPVALVVIPDAGANGVAEHLAQSKYQFGLTVSEAYRWDKNAAGTLTFGHEPPAEWGYTVTFPKGVDRWAYPRFTLPQEVDAKRVTGVLVRARCVRPGTVRLMSWDDKDKSSVTQFPIIPADGKWHVAYIPLASYQQAFAGPAGEGRPITRISIGFNSAEDTNTLEISDLYMIGK
ncbi:MAG: glycosyl hydrolase [Opitutaceae bacterium]